MTVRLRGSRSPGSTRTTPFGARGARWAALLVAGAALVAPGGAARAAPPDGMKEFLRAWEAAKDSPEKKEVALGELAALGSPEAAELLVKIALKPDEPGSIARACSGHLAALGGTAADAWIVEKAAKSRAWQERAVLVDAIGRRQGAEAEAVLIRALGDDAWQVVAAAVRGLGQHPSREAIAALVARYEKLSGKEPADVRLEGDLRDALYRLTGLTQGDARGWRQWWDEKKDSWTPDAKAHVLDVHESVTTTRTPTLFEEVYSRRVVFVIDTSYSMNIPTGSGTTPERPQGETRFQVMVKELKRIVSELPPKARFNLIRFDDDVEMWSPKLTAATPQAKRAAERFIERLEPNGTTNSVGALEAAFRDPEVDTVIFLSDGTPTAGTTIDFERIADEVRRWNQVRQVRVHAIAFLAGDGKALQIEEGDKSMPKAFMKRLAEDNDGRYRLVE